MFRSCWQEFNKETKRKTRDLRVIICQGKINIKIYFSFFIKFWYVVYSHILKLMYLTLLESREFFRLSIQARVSLMSRRHIVASIKIRCHDQFPTHTVV